MSLYSTIGHRGVFAFAVFDCVHCYCDCLCCRGCKLFVLVLDLHPIQAFGTPEGRSAARGSLTRSHQGFPLFTHSVYKTHQPETQPRH